MLSQNQITMGFVGSIFSIASNAIGVAVAVALEKGSGEPLAAYVLGGVCAVGFVGSVFAANVFDTADAEMNGRPL